jgi:hypothetical protein
MDNENMELAEIDEGMDYSAIEFEGITPDICDAITTRTVTTYKVAIVANELVVETQQAEYFCAVRWSHDFIVRAMFTDVRALVEDPSAVREFVTIFPTSLAVNTNSSSSPAVEHPMWPTISAITFKLKNKEKRISRGERLLSLIGDVSTLSGQLLSANMRLNTLRQPSPVPHVETNELMQGSSHEQAEQAALIAELEKALVSKHSAIKTQITAINAQLRTVDTGWKFSLPSPVNEITALNAEVVEDEDSEDED